MQLAGHTIDNKAFDYCDLPLEGTIEHVDESVRGAWCLDTESDNGWISYDNVATVRSKAGFVRDWGLGGLFYWTGTADKKGPGSLVEAGYEALHAL
jgi:chitinase